VTKLCNQICIAANLAGVAEAYSLAKANGLEPARVRQALLGGFAASKVMEFHGNRMITGDYKPGFFVRLFQKDLRLAVEANMASGVTMPVTSVVTQFVSLPPHAAGQWRTGLRRRGEVCGFALSEGKPSGTKHYRKILLKSFTAAASFLQSCGPTGSIGPKLVVPRQVLLLIVS
jgi:hypothetical protein